MGRDSKSDHDFEEEESQGFGKHPALRNFNRTGFIVKHVIKSALKWGAIGALAGVAAVAFASLAATISMGWLAIPVVAALGVFAPEWAAAQGTSFAVGAATTTAMVGGAVGAAVGALVSISSAGEAADAEEDRLVAKYEQMESRRERMSALEKRRDEQRFAMERQSQAMKGPGMQIPQAKGRMGPDAGHAHA